MGLVVGDRLVQWATGRESHTPLLATGGGVGLFAGPVLGRSDLALTLTLVAPTLTSGG